jgi:hypothetical protein
MAQEFTEEERARVARVRERGIYGTAAAVGERLRGLAEGLGVAEVAVLTTVHDPGARRRSYALLAGGFGLTDGVVRNGG